LALNRMIAAQPHLSSGDKNQSIRFNCNKCIRNL